MLNLLIVLIIIAAILLIIIILAQNPKGGGLAQGFSSSNQFMGVQNTNKFLMKATWTLVGFIVAASIITAGLSIPNETNAESESSIINTIQQTTTGAPNAASFPQSTPVAPAE